MTAVILRPRMDFVGKDGHGLVVELFAWSSDVASRRRAVIDDLGGQCEVSRILFHVFRTWEALPASELDRAINVDIDRRVHLCRIDGCLLDLTAYERIESRLRSAAETSKMPLDQRALLVHDRLRWTHPDLKDEAIGDLYGLGGTLFDYAIGMAGASDKQEGADERDDDFGELVTAPGRSTFWPTPCSTQCSNSRTSSALEARKVHLDGLDGIWNDTEGEVDDFTGL